MPRHTRTPSAWYIPYQHSNTLIRQYGGLYCGTDGTVSKPFPNKPYCVQGAGTLVAVNECSKQVSICQTVLPGNEAMLIPNSVPAGGDLTLAVPDSSYWCSTSAEFYVNTPGYDTNTACVWGDGSSPYGNWSPFVAGANQAANGDTFVMVGINPIYCCQSNPWPNQDPGFAVRIECPSGNCHGLPCECNPSTMGPNTCTGGTVGAGGAEFCTVTVPAGDTANLVIFSTSDKSSHNGTAVPVNAVSSNGEGADVVPAPGPAPAAPNHPNHSSSSCSSSTTSTSTSCTKSTLTTWVSAPASSAPAPAVYPSSAVSPGYQPPPYEAPNESPSSPVAGTFYAPASSAPSSSVTPVSVPSTVVQQTSNTNRATYTSTLLGLAALLVGLLHL